MLVNDSKSPFLMVFECILMIAIRFHLCFLENYQWEIWFWHQRLVVSVAIWDFSLGIVQLPISHFILGNVGLDHTFPATSEIVPYLQVIGVWIPRWFVMGAMHLLVQNCRVSLHNSIKKWGVSWSNGHLRVLSDQNPWWIVIESTRILVIPQNPNLMDCHWLLPGE